jgi:CheY-like chemotaxis protein
MEKSYNLILLDYNLPDMDGLRVAKRARELDKDASIVFISAYGTTDVIVKAERVTKATLHAHPPEDICIPVLYSIVYRILKMIPDRVGAGAIELMKSLLDRTLPGKTLA